MLFNGAWWRILGIQSCYIVIVIVAIEEGLYTVASEEHRILSHLFLVIIFPITVGILSIKIVFIGRHKRGRDTLIVEIVPIEIAEPDMVFDFLWTVQTETVNRLALYEFINKVGCL
jgi:hypothetical protein